MPEPINLSHYDRLRNAGFTLERGWSEDLARKLVVASREKEIRRSTPRDTTERFYDEDSANEWFKSKQPTVYALGRAASLAGVIWFSRRERPDIHADHTFAVRLYEEGRGQGYAEPFVQAAEKDFRSVANPQGIWLETDMDNSKARALYHKLGYAIVGANNARITMRH